MPLGSPIGAESGNTLRTYTAPWYGVAASRDDHQTVSFDAFLKFVEDVFLGGDRLDPKTDGRPDSRPIVRENVPILGEPAAGVRLHATVCPPLILPEHPSPGPASIPGT